MKKQYRQGDVLLVEISIIPKGIKKENKCILAYGEVTGHKHQIMENGVLYKSENESFLEMSNDGVLSHEEHHQIKIPKGQYKVIIQKEYNPFENLVRTVTD